MKFKTGFFGSCCFATLFLVADSGGLRGQQTETELPPSTASVDSERDDQQVSMDFLFKGENPSNIDQLRAMQDRVRDVYERVSKATVNIRVGDAQGSGVVVSRDGYILTAAHVIGRPGLDAVVTLADGRRFTARTLGINRPLDSGMLKLKKEENWPYIDIAVSEDLTKGQWVLAIGHPGGLDPDRGLVIRAGRLLASSRAVLRTDCVLVGGDSGGPLVDMNGDLIGIHSRIGTNLWDNIHVPIDVFSDEWDQLANAEIIGQKQSPYMGIDMEDETNRISRVQGGSPADQAGLKVGDVIIEFNGEKTASKRDIGNVFKKLKIGDEVDVLVQRDEQQLNLKLKIGGTWE